MARLPGFLKDPLTHFLLAGAAIVYIGGRLEPPPADPHRIVVDRPALLEFIQYRSKAFEPQAASAILDSMNKARRDQIVRDYLEEEVLYREAESLGLGANDYVIKQRLVQKLRFATEASVGEPELSESEIAAYYKENKADYAIAPSAIFTHVFFDASKRGAAGARAAAVSLAANLNKSGAGFEDAVKYGDRFLFNTNYVERTYDYVASQFGDETANVIFNPEGPFNVWRGPLTSSYGAHVVYVRQVTPGRTPPLSVIRDQVEDDAIRARKVELVNAAIDKMVSRYQVDIDLDKTGDAAANTVAAQ